MEIHKIGIRHASGVYNIEGTEEVIKDYKAQILKCLKNEDSLLIYKLDSGGEEYFPASMLQNSFLTFYGEQQKHTPISYKTR